MSGTAQAQVDGGVAPGPEAQVVGFFMGDARVFLEGSGCSVRLNGPYGALSAGPETTLYFATPDCTGPGLIDGSTLGPEAIHECRIGLVSVAGTLASRLLRPRQPIFFAQAQPFQSVSTRVQGLPTCSPIVSGPTGLYYEVAPGAVPVLDIDNGTVWYELR